MKNIFLYLFLSNTQYLLISICFKRVQSYKENPKMQSRVCKILLKRLRFFHFIDKHASYNRQKEISTGIRRAIGVFGCPCQSLYYSEHR